MSDNQATSLEEVILAYREVFETSAGQLILQDLVGQFGYTDRSMIEDGTDLMQLAAKEGQRTVLIHINRRLMQDPEAARSLEEMSTYV